MTTQTAQYHGRQIQIETTSDRVVTNIGGERRRHVTFTCSDPYFTDQEGHEQHYINRPADAPEFFNLD